MSAARSHACDAFRAVPGLRGNMDHTCDACGGTGHEEMTTPEAVEFKRLVEKAKRELELALATPYTEEETLRAVKRAESLMVMARRMRAAL